jgi:hypothetical protein
MQATMSTSQGSSLISSQSVPDRRENMQTYSAARHVFGIKFNSEILAGYRCSWNKWETATCTTA